MLILLYTLFYRLVGHVFVRIDQTTGPRVVDIDIPVFHQIHPSDKLHVHLGFIRANRHCRDLGVRNVINRRPRFGRERSGRIVPTINLITLRVEQALVRRTGYFRILFQEPDW